MSRVPPVFRLGLTGGIGSGKSTVAALLEVWGAGLIDADAISRACTAAGGAAIDSIRAQFGPDFVDAQGALQRERMRAHVFHNPAARAQLEAIIHPLVGQQIAAQSERLSDAGRHCLVYDIPLLVESGHWRQRLQRVLVLDCSPATQIARVQARSGLSRAEVEPIIASQASRAQRLQAADCVLCNDCISLAELAAQVALLRHEFGL